MREEAWPDSSLQAPLYIYRIKAVTSVEVDRLAPFQDMAMVVGPRAAERHTISRLVSTTGGWTIGSCSLMGYARLTCKTSAHRESCHYELHRVNGQYAAKETCGNKMLQGHSCMSSDLRGRCASTGAILISLRTTNLIHSAVPT
jgi:hypothetical protein